MKTRKKADRNYRYFPFLTLFAIMAMLVFACDKDDKKPVRVDSANVMAVHASPDATGATFYLDQTKISAGNLTYGQGTNYVSTPAGRRKAEFKSGENNSVMASTELDLTAKKNYTVFLAGTVAAATIVAIEDDLTPPPARKAKVRFVNLSTDDTKFDIKVSGAEGVKLATGRAFKSVSNFLEVDPGVAKYEVLNNADQALVFAMPDFTLAEGKIYTIWIKGSANGVGDAAYGAKLIVHNP